MATARATLADAISRFGIAVKAKLSDNAISGAREDQLRAPLEALLQDMVAVLGFTLANVVAIGESSLATSRHGPTMP